MDEILVMIHGMWGGAWYWENFREYFERAGYRCVVPTLRYHDVDPASPPDPRLGTTSLLDYAEDLEILIRGLGETPILMGHSMGGLLAQILGSRVNTKALVLLTPAPPYGVFALKPSVIKSFWSGLTRWGFWRNPFRQTFEEAAYSMLNVMAEDDQREVFSKFVYESGRAASEIGFWMFDRNRAARVDETKVKCPVLLIAGEQDRILPVSVERKVAEKYSSVATYKEFPNHSHWVIGESGWQEIAQYVAEWLREAVT